VARALSAALDEFLAGTARHDDEAGRETAIAAAKEAAAQAATVELSELKRGLGMLATIGSTAPFVGLFGTTFGIIDAFRSMALTGSGGIGSVSAGISEALVTTALGLLVAVPAVWAYNAFASRLERMGVEMERSAYELAVFLTRRSERERPAA
jgi:biopolymer transport protein ExbB/TolQ